MDANEARRVIESLRKGIPPDGFVRDFTVGRIEEIKELQKCLSNADGTALLLKANYGAGKSHLIRFIREEALAQNYAVSVVTLDANSAVRFNRMDQIFGAICRNIETPYQRRTKGIRSLFETIKSRIEEEKDNDYWTQLTNKGKWDYSNTLQSEALYVALRAYLTSDANAQLLVEDWLCNPSHYHTQRKKLYECLVGGLRRYFRDPRSDKRFYADQVFIFNNQAYHQSWAALRDLESLACAVGFKGLIILFDEYEDVITNMRNVSHQETAFWNLFHFYLGKQFSGMTFYAVTPEFVEKCKKRLLEKGRWDMDLSIFDALPKFEMSPLTKPHLVMLGEKILNIHKLAYGWNGQFSIGRDDLESWIEESTTVQLQDRTRQAITATVKRLDTIFQDM